jgi:CRISPR-associated protein Csb2
MLALRVDFLSGTYHAAEPTAPGYPEWPPAPDRLFQGLVSAASSIGTDTACLRALESPPEVLFGHALPVHGATVYVPAAYLAKSGNEQASRPNNAKTGPMMVNIREPVYFVWRDAHDELSSALAPVVAAMHYLGRAKSPVMVSVCAQIPNLPRHLVPNHSGEELLRVPQPGRLDELDAAFAVKARPPVASLHPYAQLGAEIARSPWSELLALRPRTEISLRQAAALAEALRLAALSHAGDGAPEVLHGHSAQPHIAWTVLPDVAHPHAEGRVLGVGAWLPAGICEQDRIKCALALARTDHLMISGRRVDVQRLPPSSTPPQGVTPGPWTRASRTWASVTPVVLDRHPKGSATIESVLADATERAGFPRPANVMAMQESLHRGAPPARSFKPRRGGQWTHVAFEFDMLVAGPLLVGRDRHFGLGLMRPIR